MALFTTTIKPKQVFVGWAYLPDWQADLSMLSACLNAQELVYAQSLSLPKVQEQFIFTRGVLRKILAEFVDSTAQDLHFIKTEKGKPSLQGAHFEFNVSHSKDIFLLGITSSQAIGVDVEYSDRAVDYLAISQRYFTRLEHQQLETCSLLDQPVLFYQLWTEKEAYLKARGLGLAAGLDQVRDPLLWQAHTFTLLERYFVTLVTKGASLLLPLQKITQNSFLKP